MPWVRAGSRLIFRLALVAGLAALSAGCAHRDAPKVFPEVDAETAKVRLAVVGVVASDFLPKFPECEMPEVLCMDPAPTWMKLNSLDVVYGEPLPRTFYASTTSHYGKITAYGAVDQPQLMLLLSEGGDIVMARYGRAPLVVDGARRFHLPLHNQGPRWLPCAVEGLREPITDPVLARATAVPRSLFDDVRGDDAERWYRIEEAFAYPRYSLPLERLEQHLDGRELSVADFDCDRPGD